MTEPTCLNGHPATLPDQRYCVVCGAPILAPVPPPPALPAAPAPGPGVGPAEPVAPPVWGQQATPASPYDQAPPAAPPRWGSPPGGIPQAFPPGGVPQAFPPGGFASPPVAPARRRSGGGVAVAGIVVILVAAAATALVVLKPGGSPAPSPVALISTSPTTAAGSGRPIATSAPTASARVVPSSAKPTTRPSASAKPSAKPKPTPSAAASASAVLPTCHSATGAFTASYPAGWKTLADGSKWSCMLFDPGPISVTADSELPDVAVMVFVDATSYTKLIKQYKSSTTTAVLQTDAGSVANHSTTVLELQNNGKGYFAKGVREAVVIMDTGAAGCLVLESTGKPGALYTSRLKGLSVILGSLVFD